MTVAILADPLDNQSAGVHVYVRELVAALDAAQTEHEYILIRQKADPAIGLRQIEVPTTTLPGYASFRLFVRIPRLLRRLGVDAVFETAHFGPFNLPDTIRRITMIHDLTPILFPQYHVRHSHLLQRLFLPGILRRADLVITNSRHTQRDLAEVYPITRGKTETILLGINDKMELDHSRKFLDEYKIDRPYFLFVGTLEPRKNLVTLLRAYGLYRRANGPTHRLVIVGRKGWRIESFFQELDLFPYHEDVVLTGFVADDLVAQAYTHATVLVYPSEYEGFGFPVLEAMARGTNVICPDNSSLPEVGGNLAYYYPTHDVRALADQLALVAAGGPEVTRRAAAGPAWAATFSWTTYARRFDAAVGKLT